VRIFAWIPILQGKRSVSRETKSSLSSLLPFFPFPDCRRINCLFIEVCKCVELTVSGTDRSQVAEPSSRGVRELFQAMSHKCDTKNNLEENASSPIKLWSDFADSCFVIYPVIAGIFLTFRETGRSELLTLRSGRKSVENMTTWNSVKVKPDKSIGCYYIFFLLFLLLWWVLNIWAGLFFLWASFSAGIEETWKLKTCLRDDIFSMLIYGTQTGVFRTLYSIWLVKCRRWPVVLITLASCAGINIQL